MIGIDLFAGAGGMALGATWAGVDVKIALELNAAAANTHSTNHPGCLTIQGDARFVTRLLNGRPAREKLVVFGGPPCQAFSTSNQKTRGPANDKNLLYKDFLKFIAALKPEWIVFENVPGILESHSKTYVNDIEICLKRMGYGTSLGVLNAAHFGVPQNRKRFFVIGALNQDAPHLPVGKANLAVSVGDAISDLPVLQNGASESFLPYQSSPSSPYAKKLRRSRLGCENNLVSDNASYVVDRYKHIPQGGNWQDIPARLMTNYADRQNCHTGIYHRLREDLPSVVIGNFRKNMLIHPTQDRGLSVREAARLQSFPDWYRFEGSIGQQQQQVGNAVPPLLAKAVFSTIMNAERKRT